MKEINDISAQTLPESVGSAAVAEELAKEVKRRKIKLIKAVSAFVVFAVVCFYITIAWFTMSREISAGSMAIKSEDAPFELEVRGTNIENEDDFSKADNDYEDGIDMEELDAYQTSGQYEKIIWRKNGSTADDGHYNEGLSPNSHGKLTFWVVPNSTGALDIEFKFKVRGFIGTYTPSATEDAEPTLNDLFEVTESMAVTLAGRTQGSFSTRSSW